MMTVDLGWVEQVRRVLAESVPMIVAGDSSLKLTRPFSVQRRLAASFPSRRRFCLLEISRLVEHYGWQREVDHALMHSGVAAVKNLDADQLEQLLARLQRLVDSIQAACDPVDAPPAR